MRKLNTICGFRYSLVALDNATHHHHKTRGFFNDLSLMDEGGHGSLQIPFLYYLKINMTSWER